MSELLITLEDLDKARSQAELLKTILDEKKGKRIDLEAAGADVSVTDALIEAIEADIGEIEEEAREYDYILFPRAAPEQCRVCNDHPFVESRDRLCAECQLPLERASVPDGLTNWVVPNGDNVALPIGEVPE